MTTQPPDPANTAAPSPAGAVSSDEGAIRRVVSEVLDGLFSSGRADVTDEPAPRRKTRARSADDADADIAGQVERAVTAAKDKEKATAREQALLTRLDELEAKEKARENPPVELRGVTRFLWGDR